MHFISSCLESWNGKIWFWTTKKKKVNFYKASYFGLFLFALQTDDKGVFATYLSQEYQLAAETFNLTPFQVWDLSYESINYIFACDNTRSELRKRWTHLKQKVLNCNEVNYFWLYIVAKIFLPCVSYSVTAHLKWLPLNLGSQVYMGSNSSPFNW